MLHSCNASEGTFNQSGNKQNLDNNPGSNVMLCNKLSKKATCLAKQAFFFDRFDNLSYPSQL